MRHVSKTHLSFLFLSGEKLVADPSFFNRPANVGTMVMNKVTWYEFSLCQTLQGQSRKVSLRLMDSVCVIVLASNGNGGRKTVSEPLWGGAGSSLKGSCASFSTSSTCSSTFHDYQ
jgi:hypothetical protein